MSDEKPPRTWHEFQPKAPITEYTSRGECLRIGWEAGRLAGAAEMRERAAVSVHPEPCEDGCWVMGNDADPYVHEECATRAAAALIRALPLLPKETGAGEK